MKNLSELKKGQKFTFVKNIGFNNDLICELLTDLEFTKNGRIKQFAVMTKDGRYASGNGALVDQKIILS